MSGENLRDVMPRSWARGMVTRGIKFKDFEVCAGVGETDRGLGSSIEEAYDLNLDLDLDLDLDLETERRLERDCLRSL
jgi:hypothetical protein